MLGIDGGDISAQTLCPAADLAILRGQQMEQGHGIAWMAEGLDQLLRLIADEAVVMEAAVDGLGADALADHRQQECHRQHHR